MRVGKMERPLKDTNEGLEAELVDGIELLQVADDEEEQ